MAVPGKEVRWNRFVDPRSRQALIVPIDHGLTLGPVEGLMSVNQIGGWLGSPSINGVVAHKGMVAKLAEVGLLTGLGVMVHLNGMTSISQQPDTKEFVTTIETAIRLGADAVSLQVNFRPDNHAHNLVGLGQVVDEADRFGLPVLAMVYPAGPTDDAPGRALRMHRHYLRVAFELGVDVVKTAPPEHLEDIPELLDGVGDDLRVLFSGGALTSDDSLMSLAKSVANSNAAGLCIGRNVFQRSDPQPILTQLRDLLDA
jgi:class I fructose-bisphosphate aldolase/fructose-bisphosphate aldolase/2-amino-3,7-dideoxy-D-threo-hept-6-ulosonate synthase